MQLDGRQKSVEKTEDSSERRLQRDGRDSSAASALPPDEEEAFRSSLRETSGGSSLRDSPCQTEDDNRDRKRTTAGTG